MIIDWAARVEISNIFPPRFGTKWISPRPRHPTNHIPDVQFPITWTFRRGVCTPYGFGWNGSSLQSLMPLEIRILWMPRPRSKLVQRPISIRSLKHASLNINKARVERRTVIDKQPFRLVQISVTVYVRIPRIPDRILRLYWLDWPMHSMDFILRVKYYV